MTEAPTSMTTKAIRPTIGVNMIPSTIQMIMSVKFITHVLLVRRSHSLLIRLKVRALELLESGASFSFVDLYRPLAFVTPVFFIGAGKPKHSSGFDIRALWSRRMPFQDDFDDVVTQIRLSLRGRLSPNKTTTLVRWFSQTLCASGVLENATRPHRTFDNAFSMPQGYQSAFSCQYA